MLKWIALLLVSLTIASIGGCAHRGGNDCDGWKPIYLTQTDVLTMDPDTKRQIVAHNEFGEKTCGWKPAAMKRL